MRSIQKAEDLPTDCEEQAEFLRMMTSGSEDEMAAACTWLDLCADLQGLEAAQAIYNMLPEVCNQLSNLQTGVVVCLTLG